MLICLLAYERHFGEHQSEKLSSERVAQVDEKQWHLLAGTDKQLGQQIYYTLDTATTDGASLTFDRATSSMRTASSTTQNGIFGVKRRLADAWNKCNSKSAESDAVGK